MMKKMVTTMMMAMAISLLGILGIIAMYFSSTFIPVYVNGQYIIANQIIRYVIYFILFFTVIISFLISVKLLDKIQKRRRRNARRRR